MKTLEEVKHYYHEATKDEIILDNYLDMVEHQKVLNKIEKLKDYIENIPNFCSFKDTFLAKQLIKILNEGSVKQ